MDMELILVVAKFVQLIVALAYGTTVVGKIIHGQSVSQFQVYAWATGAAGFITLQWLL